MVMMCDFNKLKNGILVFIIGDALGVPLEFKKREIFKNNKVTDMISSDRIGVKGVWSDDSSMVIATMKAIIDNKGKINYERIILFYGFQIKILLLLIKHSALAEQHFLL